jgi:predicted nucleic acid-binding protein
MIVVDTSVVIDYLRASDRKLLHLFQHHDAAICGVTRSEVLAGMRSPGHRQRIVAALDVFRQIETNEALWDRLGDHLSALRTNGVSVPMADVIIATIAIENDAELWTRDRHFQHVQAVLQQLRLFQEPP